MLKTIQVAMLAAFLLCGSSLTAETTLNPMKSDSNSLQTTKIADRFTPADIAQVHLSGIIGGHVDSAARRLNKGQIERFVKVIEQGGSWSGWNGCYAGWWLEAALNSWKYSQDEKMRSVIAGTVNRLLKAQQPDGYIGDYALECRFYKQDWNNLDMPIGWPPKNMAQFDVWDTYCTVFGLTKYYEVTGDQRALEAARRLADLIVDTFGDGKQDIMKINFDNGHISAAVIQGFGYLYGVTGDRKYLDFCKYIASRYGQKDTVPILLTEVSGTGYPFLDTAPIVKHMEFEYNLTGLCELYRFTGDKKWLITCQNLYDGYYAPLLKSMVFHGFHTAPEGVKVPRTYHGTLECCDLNGIDRWFIEMARLTGETKYLDALEWLLYNVYLPRDLPDGKVSPHGINADKNVAMGISKDVTDDVFHCCWNSVPLGHSYLPAWCYFTTLDGILVNFYEPSTLSTDAGGVKVHLEQKTKYPMDVLVEISVEPEKPADFSLYLRIPGWCETAKVLVNGKAQEGVHPVAGSLARLNRLWTKNDRVSLAMEMPAKVATIKYPGGKNIRTIERGPLILCATEILNPDMNLDSIVAFEETDGTLKGEALDTGGFRATAVVPADGGQARKTVPVILTPYADVSADGGYRVEFAQKNKNAAK